MTHMGQSPQAHFGPPPDAPVQRPASSTLAVRFMYGGAALSLIGLILTFATIGSVRDKAKTATSGLRPSPDQVVASVHLALVAGFVSGVIGIALWIWMAWKNGQGRSWARVLGTILGGVNIVSTIVTASTGQATTPSILVAVLSAILAIVIIVLMFRKNANVYYAARSNKAPQYT